jgi:hypothetical protein
LAGIQKAAGHQHALSEALLIVPLAECLAAKGYTLETETDTSQFGVGAPGSFNYDALARNGSTTIFLETKISKKA